MTALWSNLHGCPRLGTVGEARTQAGAGQETPQHPWSIAAVATDAALMDVDLLQHSTEGEAPSSSPSVSSRPQMLPQTLAEQVQPEMKAGVLT